MPIKKSQLSWRLIKNGYRIKKTLHANNVQRAAVVEKREIWVTTQQTLDLGSLVFVDESSINCGKTLLYGCARKRERVNDCVPDFRFERTSIISSIRINAKQAPFMFKGTLNRDVFAVYISEVLAPTLNIGDAVIIDNSCVHKVSGILSPIYEMDASVLFYHHIVRITTQLNSVGQK